MNIRMAAMAPPWREVYMLLAVDLFFPCEESPAGLLDIHSFVIA